MCGVYFLLQSVDIYWKNYIFYRTLVTVVKIPHADLTLLTVHIDVSVIGLDLQERTVKLVSL
jgi:hypothetical protein